MHTHGIGAHQPNRSAFGQAGPGPVWQSATEGEGGAVRPCEAEAPLASSDKHFQDDRDEPVRAAGATSPGTTSLPAVWQPSLEKHWRAADEGGVELMRAALGVPAPPAQLRLAPPPGAAGAPLPDMAQPAPGGIDQDPQSRFRASMLLALTILAVLLAAAFTSPIR
jgi:hypothetical protein